MANQHKILGTSNQIETCQHCGRTDLKKGAWLGVLDADGNVEAELAVGMTCASRLTRRSVRWVRRVAEQKGEGRFHFRFGGWGVTANLHGVVSLRNFAGQVFAPEEVKPAMLVNVRKEFDARRAELVNN